MVSKFPFDDNELRVINQMIQSGIESALLERDRAYAHPCGIHNWDIEKLRAAITSLKPKDEFHAGQVFLTRLLDYYEEHRIETAKNPVHQFENFMDRVAASLDRDGKIDPKIDFEPDEYEMFRKVVPSINRRKVLVGAGLVGGSVLLGCASVRGLDKMINDDPADKAAQEHEASPATAPETQLGPVKAEPEPESFMTRWSRLKSKAAAPAPAPTAPEGWKGVLHEASKTIHHVAHATEKMQPAIDLTLGSVALWYGLEEYQKARFEQVSNALERLLDQTRTVKRRDEILSNAR